MSASPNRAEVVRRRTFQSLILGAGAGVGSMAVLPYALHLQGTSVAEVAYGAGVPAAAFVATVFGQGFVICTVLAGFGLTAAHRVGLTAPVSAALARGLLPSMSVAVLARAAGVGLALAALLYALGRGFEPLLPEAMEAARTTKPDPTSGLLASLYGGIVEEIVSRLFLLSVLAWGLRALFARRDPELPTGVFWAANLIAAVAFGLLHAPAMAATGTPLTPAVWGYLVLLNGVAGATFGLQYRNHGLEVAMVAHFAADVGLHAIIPLLGL